ncbi:molybdopterin converting factor subunit 1 [Saccharophagus sp. K07]|uniref:molybdopterin converting factor subunit 1 n=1 Tax=Saccharophagus sp. K07 TaxID=2283636 RepID=UPI0016524DAA|nr:molybdopterin converting factor subunit 1 [Saccharophagus sp. K07]MBC6905546.1 molybdopterin converting factor subunit 1 [Saccharophagus sp. K07]
MSGAITVLFFASLADQLQCRSLSLPITSRLTVQQLRDQLIQEKGAAWAALNSERLRCAVNQQIVKLDHVLQSGDEVAFFPPVTGG